MKKAIIVGASSGIGRELAKILAGEGYAVGLVARREKFLRNMQGGRSFWVAPLQKAAAQIYRAIERKRRMPL